LAIYDRNIIEEYYFENCTIKKKPEHFKNLTFKPKINKNSEKKNQKIERDNPCNKNSFKLAQEKGNSKTKLKNEINKLYNQNNRYKVKIL